MKADDPVTKTLASTMKTPVPTLKAPGPAPKTCAHREKIPGSPGPKSSTRMRYKIKGKTVMKLTLSCDVLPVMDTICLLTKVFSSYCHQTAQYI